MRKQLLCSVCSLVGIAFLAGLAACSSNASEPQPNTGNPQPDAGNPLPDAGNPLPDAGNPLPDAGNPLPDAAQGCQGGAPSNYVLIDDMETTTHGPIEFVTGIDAPLTPGYWYNSGAGSTVDGGISGDMSTPPQMSFVFSALPSPTTTCKTSAHAARQSCALNGLYDTCGVGFEFAQQPDVDAGAPSNAAADDAGDGGPSVPRTTIPFDISGYKAVTFWGMTTTPDPDAGSLQVKMSFPDTDTDPRGQICNGGGGNTSRCYNSYAANFKFTNSWQQFTVTLDAGKDGAPMAGAGAGGIAIDPTWGYQGAQWIPTQVYGINWQAQRNIGPEAGPPLMTDIWIDDVYFVE